jgi:hypothetical protein
MWKTTVLADRDRQSEAAKLLDSLQKKDDSFKWSWGQREGDLVIEVVSRNDDQAYKRAEWLTKRTEAFYNAPYLVEEVEQIFDTAKRPKKIERLQDYWRHQINK